MAPSPKKTKKRKASSARWISRQLRDPYVQQAQKEGYRSRAAYKLLEINERFAFLKPGQCVIDLGSAPGGWSQVLQKKCTSAPLPGKPGVIAIDLLEMDPIPGVLFLQKDFLESDTPALIRAQLGEHPVDGVISDMAAPTTGHRTTDHLRTCLLAQEAADFARTILTPGGFFLCKVFQGGTQQALLVRLKKDFKRVVHVKPPASRTESVEMYVLALGFKM